MIDVSLTHAGKIQEFPELAGVEPLFTPDDYRVFDRYSDGDPYGDEAYIQRFRLILDAVRHKYPLSITTLNRKGGRLIRVMLPGYLEYSEKDDKFRLIGSGGRYGSTVNLGRIISCAPYSGVHHAWPQAALAPRHETVVFELWDQRNALERVLMHFAHFEKEAERLKDDRYRVKITYDRDDETEMVIRILSFGPMVRVVSPPGFVDLIKNRLSLQKSYEQ